MSESTRHSLAFGAHHAHQFLSPRAAVDEAHRLVPGLIDLDFAPTDNFCSYTAGANLNGLTLASICAPARRCHMGGEPAPVLLIPLSGMLKFEGDGFAPSIEAKKTALYISSNRPIYIETGASSPVLIRFHLPRLLDTAQRMLGESWNDCLITTFCDPTQIALQCGRFSHDVAFRGLFSLVDSWGENETLRNLSGLDDLFYRALVMAMLPKHLLGESEKLRTACASAHQFNRVCEYITANLDQRITLTDLERIGGLSSSGLHQAFMRAYNMSPMAWVRMRRLASRCDLLKSSLH